MTTLTEIWPSGASFWCLGEWKDDYCSDFQICIRDPRYKQKGRKFGGVKNADFWKVFRHYLSP